MRLEDACCSPVIIYTFIPEFLQRHHNKARMNPYNEALWVGLLLLVSFCHSCEYDGANKGLTSVPVGHFTQCYQIDLSQNAIEVLPARAFAGVTHATSLDLRRNRIRTIEDDAFHGLSELSTLNLDWNSIAVISKNAFKGLDELLSLTLNHNLIPQLNTGSFSSLKSCKYLKLANNRIATFNNHAFQGLDNLETLTLDNNSIAVLGNKTFNGLEKVYSLSLNGNPLKKVQPGAFKPLQSLSILAIAGTQLDTLDSDWFGNLDEHLRLDLHSPATGAVSPWRCETMCWIRGKEKAYSLGWLTDNDGFVHKPQCIEGDWESATANCSTEGRSKYVILTASGRGHCENVLVVVISNRSSVPFGPGLAFATHACFLSMYSIPPTKESEPPSGSFVVVCTTEREAVS